MIKNKESNWKSYFFPPPDWTETFAQKNRGYASVTIGFLDFTPYNNEIKNLHSTLQTPLKYAIEKNMKENEQQHK